MPGQLARHLAQRLRHHLPPEWKAKTECGLFSERDAARLGFQAQADVLLTAPDGQRIAIEFEISRADPVANHAKFVVAYSNGALGPRDTFVSMVSSHVTRGRRQLAASFTRYMRATGLPAFQVALLPTIGPEDVKRLNHARVHQLQEATLPIQGELDRVLAVTEPRGIREHRIHFAGDAADVLSNCWAWNDEMAGSNASLWNRRAVQFFVADPVTKQFAPSKFCAYLPSRKVDGPMPPPTMTLKVYSSLGEQDPRFDGNRARRHLVDQLGFREDSQLRGPLAGAWAVWQAAMKTRLILRGPVTWLLPPPWWSKG